MLILGLLFPTNPPKKRGIHQAANLLADIAFRININKPQISTDGLPAYEAAIRRFWPSVDYGKVISNRRYVVLGEPQFDKISTTYIERHNATMRAMNKRIARKTYGFSKNLQAHQRALAVTLLWYNFCRPHTTLGITPAQAAGLTDYHYDLDWFEELVRNDYAKPVPRGPYFPPLSPYLIPEHK